MFLVEKYNSMVRGVELPEHIKVWSNKKKLDWLVTHLTPFVDDLYTEFSPPSTEKIRMILEIGENRHELVFPPELASTQQVIIDEGTPYIFQVPGRVSPPKPDDELRNYAQSYIRAMMDFVVFDSIIHAGDVDRLAPMLKRFIPLFVGLTSFRSKYAIEAVNFLTKTEHSLSKRESVKVKLRSFVNLSGVVGQNKSADMQQEINIKKCKNVIRGLGAGKTDRSMVQFSQAAPGISHLAEALREALELRPSASRYDHHKKDDTEDKRVLKEVLCQGRPFQIIPGRTIDLDLEPSVTEKVDKFKLNSFLERNARRATNQCVPDFDDDNDDEDYE